MDTIRKQVIELNIEDVLPNRFQPRIKFNEEAIEELSKSIKEHGVIQPIVVRPIGDKYEIIAGERRYKASCMADLRTIPAIITDLNDKDSAEVALIENVQREDLTPIEEAISYKKILDMGYITQESLATKLGKTQSTVANKLRLLNLDDEVQEALLNERISERHARSLLKLTDKEDQKKMLNRITSERLTVRRADEEIDKIIKGESNNNEEIFNSVTSENNMVEKEKKVEEPQEEPTKFRFINTPIEEQTQMPEEIEKKEEQKAQQEQEEITPVKFFNILSNNENTPIEKDDLKTSENDINNIFNFNNFEEIKNPSPIEINAIQNNALLEEVEEIENSINNSNTLPPIENQEHEENKSNQEIKSLTEEPSKQYIDDDELEFIEEFEDEEEISNNTDKEINNIKEESTREQKITMESGKIDNMKDVIQLIRNCSEKIEASGFIVDTEEIDLDNMYQVIFKINKMD